MIVNAAIAQSQEAQPVPIVGDGATVLFPNDREAATVTEVSASGKRVTVQLDKSLLVRGSHRSEEQEYEYVRNERGAKYTFFMRANGTYVREGDRMGTGSKLVTGHRDTYREPSV